ncbi:hypothetical protein [Halovivax limisalsi]|nr:hypothetical protein [Halovivax limisalsi]
MATNQRPSASGPESPPEPADGAGMAHPTVVPTNFDGPSSRTSDDE